MLAVPYPVPERLVAADPELLVDHMLDSLSTTPGAFPDSVRDAYRCAFRDPATVHTVCEEYRATATLDYEHDGADRGKRRIACPVLALWAKQGELEEWYDVLAVRRDWTDAVSGQPIDAGHYLAEEAPDETYDALYAFFSNLDE